MTDPVSVANVLKMITTYETIGKDIDKIRQERNLSFAELGRRMKCNPIIIRNHIHGYSNPDLKTIFKYCNVLNVEITFAPRRKR